MKAPREQRVAVVGGGIAGLTVAVALLRKGFDVHVYEAAPSYASVGGGHWLYGNALQTLEQVGVDLVRDMQARGKGFDGFLFTTNRGRRLLFERTAPFAARVGYAPIVLHRKDIIEQLAKHVPPERLHFGKRLARCRGDTLEFEDGTTAPAPIVIGADGIHSRVRTEALGPIAPRDSGQVGLWGVSAQALPEDTGRLFMEMWGDGVRVGFTYVGTGEVYWFMVVRDRAIPDSPEAIKAFILDNGAAFPDSIMAVVENTDAAQIHHTPLFDVSPIRRWHSDRAVCLGDAVHACTPNLGQGGCQAIEDAYWLAEMLDRHQSAEAAFAAFQRVRYRRTSAVMYLSRWLGNLAQAKGRVLGALRYAATWLLPVLLLRPLLMWIMTLPQGWERRD